MESPLLCTEQPARTGACATPPLKVHVPENAAGISETGWMKVVNGVAPYSLALLPEWSHPMPEPQPNKNAEPKAALRHFQMADQGNICVSNTTQSQISILSHTSTRKEADREDHL